MAAREDGFDRVKGVAILLVVFGHVWIGMDSAGLIADARLFSTVEAAVYLFHMPVFFFVSGLFFSARAAPRRFLEHKVLTLLWPLLLWSWVEGAILWLSGQGADRGLAGVQDVLAYPVPVKSVFWFLWVLFVLQLATYAVQRWIAEPRWVLSGLLLGSVGIFLFRLNPGSAVMILENAPYFLLGVLLVPLRQRFAAPGILPFVGVLAVFALAEVLWLRFGGVVAWFQLAALGAVLGFTAVVTRVGGEPGRWLAWLGRRTMPVYLVHVIVTSATRVALLKLGVTDMGTHLVLGIVLGTALPLMLDGAVQRLRLGALAGFGLRQD